MMQRLFITFFLGFGLASAVTAQTASQLQSPLMPTKSVIKLGTMEKPALVLYENDRYQVFLHFDAYCSHLEEKVKLQHFPLTESEFQKWKSEIRTKTAKGDTLRLLDIPFVYDGFWMENTLEDDLMVQRLLSLGYAKVYNKSRQRFEKKLVIRRRKLESDGQLAIEISYRLSGGKALFANHYPI